MEYLNPINKTPIIWGKKSHFEHGECILVTVKKPDGARSVKLLMYDGYKNGFWLPRDMDIVAFAIPAQSVEEFEEAKSKGMADEIVWHCSPLPLPEKNGDYLLQLPEYRYKYAIDTYVESIEDFHHYSVYEDEITAWAELPAPCRIDFKE